MSAAPVDEVKVKEHSILDQASALGGIAVVVPGIATALGMIERWAYLQVMGWSAPAFKIAMLGPAYETLLLGAALLGLCGLAWWVLRRLRHKWIRRLLISAVVVLILVPLGYVTAANSYSSGTVLLTPPDVQQRAAEKGGGRQHISMQ